MHNYYNIQCVSLFVIVLLEQLFRSYLLLEAEVGTMPFPL